jgi:polyisoprenyl-phosphate glycosyltransferase
LKYTIVIPCHNEEENIENLYEQIKNAMEYKYDFNILFVNDGSSDRTIDKIRMLHNIDPRVKHISFLSNYGHQKALFAGLRLCKHEFAITMDADLQHPPEFIPDLIEKQKQTNAQIVSGCRRGGQAGFFKNFFSETFYRVFAKVCGIDLQAGISDFRLYTREALDIICAIEERDPFLRGMIANLRLRTEVIEYDLQERSHGIPSYTFLKSFRMAYSALIRFSKFPIRIGIIIGLCGVLLSIGEAVHYLYLRLFTDQLVPGQADLMVFLGLISSMILLLLSLLLKISMEIMNSQRKEPIYIIEDFNIEE